MPAEPPSASSSRRPWPVDRTWADPLLAFLALLAFILLQATLRQRAVPPPAPDRITLAGRLGELPVLAPRLLGLARKLPGTDVPVRGAGPWDRGALAVVAAMDGDLARSRELATGADPALAVVLDHAFGSGPAPAPSQRDRVDAGLRGSCSGLLLAARLQDQAGGDGTPLRDTAHRLALRRLGVLATAGLLALLLGLGGLGFGLYLALAPARPQPPLPHWPLPGRALGLLLLAWLNLLLLSTSLVHPLVRLLPQGLHPLGLPMAYTLHAAGALTLLMGFTGLSCRDLRDRLFPRAIPETLGWGAGFLAVAVVAVFLVGLATAPLLRHAPPPQQQLLEGFGAPMPAWMVLTVGLTAAGLAPLFEEFLFRGVVLPWCAERWGGRRAVVAAALLFAAIHVLPTALPTLCTLGLVMGTAFRRSGDLRSAILVHTCWNGGIFLFVRALG